MQSNILLNAGKSSFKASLSDRVNPIVVKELRQAVQSRFVIAALLTLLAIQLVAIGIYLLASGDTLLSFDAGRQVFLMLFAILQGVSMLFVPLYTAVRLAAERSDTNVDLLFITTIKPRGIIAGKMLAAVVLTVLIFSTCMPFMAFTYFLRGIDLPSIFFSLAFGFIVVIACAQAAVFVACLPVSRALKLIFGLIELIVFAVAYFAAMAAVSGLVVGGIHIGIRAADFWRGVIVMLIVAGLLIGLFFVLSVALIMPLASNRALPVRLFITIAWLAIGATSLIYSAVEKDHGPVIAWQVMFNLVFAVALFVAVSERDRLGRRMLRAVPRSSLKRALSFFFFSGAASGLAWASVMVGLTLVVARLWAKARPAYANADDLIDSVKWLGGMCLSFFCYALSGALLRRHLLSRIGAEMTWIVSAILLALGSIVPLMIGYLVFFNDQWWSEDFAAWFVGNPFAWGNKGHRVLYVSVAGVWAVLVAALSLHWFIGRVKSFERVSSPTVREGLDS
jgi:hypothetical protein